MALENETWRLSVAERMLTRESGIHDVLAGHVGANLQTFNVLAAGNVLNRTLDGDLGHMVVSVAWTQDDRWHLHNLRFEGSYTAGLNDEQLRVLGGMAVGRETIVRDYTRDAYGLPLTRPGPELVMLDVQPALQDLEPVALANAAA